MQCEQKRCVTLGPKQLRCKCGFSTSYIPFYPNWLLALRRQQSLCQPRFTVNQTNFEPYRWTRNTHLLCLPYSTFGVYLLQLSGHSNWATMSHWLISISHSFWSHLNGSTLLGSHCVLLSFQSLLKSISLINHLLNTHCFVTFTWLHHAFNPSFNKYSVLVHQKQSYFANLIIWLFGVLVFFIIIILF